MSKKRKIFIVISIIVLIGIMSFISYTLYKHFTKEEVIAEYKLEELPRIDASLATQPLTDALYAELAGMKVEDLNIEYSNTHPAYVKLINGETDIIVVTEPSDEELKLASDNNVELEVIPIVNEAFVFFVNKDNPVDNLSLKDIQNVYSGKTANWKNIGGDDEKILAYQRPTNSGSQTGMLSLVMKDIKIKEPLKEEYIETMAGIIEVVANYDNAKGALGYSYYYYANTMYGNDNIKFIGVDGVKPTYETIQDKSYPLMSAYYIVINKNEPKDSKVRKIVSEFLSNRGQKVAKETGYVPVNKIK